MKLTEKQSQGLELALQRYRNGERYTVISGYAGTGKSTLVRFIIEALKGEGIKDSDVVYTSFTGKATQVLAKKGNKNTLTLHKLLFKSRPMPDGTYIRMPVDSIDYKIIVIDEISMAPMSLLQQLNKYPGLYILCLGDPFQLPPIYKNEDNHLLDNPHIFLDEIMRQAAESEIIQLTMKIRNGEPLQEFKGKEVQILHKKDLMTGMLSWADQILVATNQTKDNINQTMRKMLGRSESPEDGDKVICCRNYWDTISENDNALINGTIGVLKDVRPVTKWIPKFLTANNRAIKMNLISAEIIDGDENFSRLDLDKNLILNNEKTLPSQVEYRINSNFKWKHLLPFEFEYGYAITTHRAQGSEWDNVLVIEEKFPFSKEEHARWLYTACTRASSKLVLVLKD